MAKWELVQIEGEKSGQTLIEDGATATAPKVPKRSLTTRRLSNSTNCSNSVQRERSSLHRQYRATPQAHAAVAPRPV